MTKLSTFLIIVYIGLLIISTFGEMLILAFVEPIKINVNICHKQQVVLYNILYLIFFSQLILILLNFVTIKYWYMTENGPNELFQIFGSNMCITAMKMLIIFYNIFHGAIFTFVVFQKYCTDNNKLLISILSQFLFAFLPFLYSFIFFLYYKFIYYEDNTNQNELLQNDISNYNGMFYNIV